MIAFLSGRRHCTVTAGSSPSCTWYSTQKRCTYFDRRSTTLDRDMVTILGMSYFELRSEAVKHAHGSFHGRKILRKKAHQDASILASIVIFRQAAFEG